MTIAILIIASILWLGDLIECFKVESNGILFTGALLSLLYWPICLPMGIITICFSGIGVIYFLAND